MFRLATMRRVTPRAGAMWKRANATQTRWSSSSSKWDKWRAQVRDHAQEAMAASKWVDEHGSPYKVLGLQEDAPPEDVKAAFRRLSLTNHPDKGGDLSEFQKIQTAQNMILKGHYSGTEDKMGVGSIGKNRLRLLILGLVAGCSLAAYVIIWLPFIWALRKLGILSPAALPPAPAGDIRAEVRRLQETVNKLQDTLDDVREQLRANRTTNNMKVIRP
eukprot:TRINITY_DN1453_c0_g1_i1.p1 TRINITY_DN1453_c0_g1~~TRINITY_DN1453_c0_g1_i1.p1  ORF type:complete len:217 (+),score=29.66 TRINITY_DN1453_c0_g1_i1:56-706(+)